MMKPLFACLVLAALPSAALSQPADRWTVAAAEDGCIAHTSLPQGTVVSVLAGVGQDNLLFLIQNKNWTLRDGARHNLAVRLDGSDQFSFSAVARTQIDQDGPGFMFAVPPGEQRGAKFLAAFANASGMNVGEDGRALADLRLSGGGSAMAELAQCMSRMWGATGHSPEPAVKSVGAVPL